MNKEEIFNFLKKSKVEGNKISCLTSYDYPSARLVDEAGVDLILVGDSLGMVVLGHPDTTTVTLNDILHHLKAVRRGTNKAIVAADLPIHTFDTPAQAVKSSHLLHAAGADMVKLEGPLSPQIKAIVKEGIPVIAHLGMLCQQILVEKKYSMKGKTKEEAERLLCEAHEIQKAGASAVVLELVNPPVAKKITKELDIPTIGIGSGLDCNGQILVLSDLLGVQPWFRPSFVQPKADLASAIQKAVKDYTNDVKTNHGQ